MNSERKTEILVGFFLLVGLMLLGGIILQFGSIRSIFRDTYILQVSFTKASGIKQGSPIYLGGSRIGKVKHFPRLNETYTGVIIDLEIFDNVEVPRDAAFVISSDGLMGDALVEIQPTGKETKEFIPHDYDQIIKGQSGGGLSDLQEQAEIVAKKVDLILDDVRTALIDVKGVMGKVNKEALSDTTIKDFKETMEHLNKTMARVDENVLGDENAATLKAALTDIKDAATCFKNSAKNVEESSKRLVTMFDKLDPAITKADKVMTTADDSLQSIKKAADSFAATARNINTSKGLIGALMNDTELKDEFSDLISNLKRNGIIFYKNSADTERAQSETKVPPDEAAKRKPLFGR